MAKSIFTRADSLPERWVLPTPSLGLNRALNGGFRSGMIHTFWGSKASGKSTVAQYCIAQAQDKGFSAIYIDAEKTFTPAWALRCGVNLGELDICFESKAETILEELLPKLRKNESQIVVVDSLSSIFFEGYFDDSGNRAIGGGARAQNFFISKILEAMDPFDSQIICIAHQGNAQAGGQSMSLQAKISESVKMWSASIIKFRKDMSKDEYRAVPNRMTIHWEVEKSKWSNYPVGGQYHLWANPDEDVYVDTIAELTRAAIETGLFIKSGAWYKYGELNLQGENGITKLLKEDEDLLNQVKKELGL